MKYCKTSAAPTYAKQTNVQICDKFFTPFLEKLRTVTIHDVIKKQFTPESLGNYRRVAEGLSGGHIGPPWCHGLICEIIRAAADFLLTRPDSALEARIEEAIDCIIAAQNVDPEGWINPYTTLVCPDQRWGLNGGYPGREDDDYLPGNARWQHELYNTGVLVEAGIHYYRATGKTRLLVSAVKMANYMSERIGPPPKWNAVCEHALPEMAMISLERLFDEEPELADRVGATRGEYLRLADFFINQKGNWTDRHQYPGNFGAYAQDHLPAKQQLEAVGHAVRATLFYAGMADLAYAQDDKELRHAAETLWHDITSYKLHINGGVGAYKDDERFGDRYELPNDAYLETCAGVGLCMFGASLFRLTRDATIWDTVETTIHNLIPGSVSEDGVHYFYENPLISGGSIERWTWHSCPCCPPMLLKLAGVLPSYIAAADGDDLWLNLYIDSKIAFCDATMQLKDKTLTVSTQSPKKLHIRIPDWAYDFALNLPYKTELGYAVVDIAVGTTDIQITYTEKIEKLIIHPMVTNNAGRVAIRRGPVLYCCEQPTENGKAPDPILANTAPVLTEGGTIRCATSDGNAVELIEYRRWNNRGPLPMAVWLRQDGGCEANSNWDGKLYQTYRAYSYNA